MIGPVARWRRALYRSGILRSDSLPRPVISVGNLTVGGTGKTPHILFLAAWLAGLGRKVAVLSRGYGRRGTGVLWVSHGEGPEVPAAAGGDEPVLIAAALPGVPVLVGESRAEAGRECLRRRDVDVFLLDDGFQHLSLRRDIDILLVDAFRGMGNRRTLPFGPLRESPDSARFADALVLTKCGRDMATAESLLGEIPFSPSRPRAATRLVPRSVVDRGGLEYPLPPAEKEVVAFCGLAQNEPFVATLEEAGFSVKRFLPFSDHHPYRRGDIDRIAEMAGGMTVLTTEKDLVRLPDSLPFEIRALRIGVSFLFGWDELSRVVIDRIDRSMKR